MRGLRFIILGVAVAAGIGAVALVRSELDRARRPAPVAAKAPKAPKPVEREKVLVAARELKMGELLKPADLRWQPWPKDAISEFYLTEKARPNALKEVEGVIVRRGLVAGEPISDAKLIRLRNPSVMAAFLRRGMRGMSVKVSSTTSAGGFVLPGDYVDVIMTAKAEVHPDDPEQKRKKKALVSRTILTSVRVLAMDKQFVADGEANAGKVQNATLEVTPDQAEVLALAEQGGALRLALRSVAELIPSEGRRPIEPTPQLNFDPRRPEEDTEPEGPGDTVQVIRFNAKSSITVK